jgi:hypothetical protein
MAPKAAFSRDIEIETSCVQLPVTTTSSVALTSEAPPLIVPNSPGEYRYTFSPISPYTPRPISAVSPHLLEQQSYVTCEPFSVEQPDVVSWNSDGVFTSELSLPQASSIVAVASRQPEKHCLLPVATMTFDRPDMNQSTSSLQSSRTSRTDCGSINDRELLCRHSDVLKAVKVTDALSQVAASQTLPNVSLSNSQLIHQNRLQPAVGSSADHSFEFGNQLQLEDRQRSLASQSKQSKGLGKKFATSSSVVHSKTERPAGQFIPDHSAASKSSSSVQKVSLTDNDSFVSAGLPVFHWQQQNVSTSTLPLYHLDSSNGMK